MGLEVGVLFLKARSTRVRLAPGRRRSRKRSTRTSLPKRNVGLWPLSTWLTVSGISTPHSAGVIRSSRSVELRVNELSSWKVGRPRSCRNNAPLRVNVMRASRTSEACRSTARWAASPTSRSAPERRNSFTHTSPVVGNPPWFHTPTDSSRTAPRFGARARSLSTTA